MFHKVNAYNNHGQWLDIDQLNWKHSVQTVSLWNICDDDDASSH
jgi:hypothetical protein